MGIFVSCITEYVLWIVQIMDSLHKDVFCYYIFFCHDIPYHPFFHLLTDLSDLDPNADLKSPISLVHEIALKRNLTVAFEVIRESGPPHMRTFVTVCIVGEYRTEGEGTGKKVCPCFCSCFVHTRMISCC